MLRTQEIVGDQWGLSIVAAALSHGSTHLSDFRHHVGAPRRVLESRLDGLVLAGLMTHRSGPAHGKWREYVLTDAGRDLRTVVDAMGAWGDRWTAPAGSAVATAGSCGPGAMQAGDARWQREDPLHTGTVTEISVLGAFMAQTDHDVVGGISRGGQRLLVFLALTDCPTARVAVAGALWPEVSDHKAGSSLRSALARMDPVARSVIHATPSEIGLWEGVRVDLRDARALAHRVVEHGRDLDADELGLDAVSILSSELLPDWYESWVVAEAEEWRQLRLSALEAAACELAADRRFAEAAVAARAAVRAEPLRESAHACLLQVHLAEGNPTEAVRVFERYRGLLRSELDMEPTRHLLDLIRGVRDQGSDAPERAARS